MKKLPGVKTPYRKKTAAHRPAALPLPEEVTLLMCMHIGAPARPVVSPGDRVAVGQPVGEADGAVSSPVHASVSGTVTAVGEALTADGRKTTAVTIAPDGLQTVYGGLQAPVVESRADFLKAAAQSGVVGLGGAGFPTAVKLGAGEGRAVDCVIVNAAECEPYITSDTRTLIDDGAGVARGVALLLKYLDVREAVVAVERNKPEAIAAIRSATEGMASVSVRVLPDVYPQGAEKVLVYSVTGRIVPEGGLPADVGVLVLNCTTVAALARYVDTGMPLVSKCVTVDGSAVAEPKNVLVPIGTPISHLLEHCGGAQAAKIMYGGPMMGLCVADGSMPVLKTTNAVLAFNEKDAQTPPETPCIRCGRCVDRCPMGLMPLHIETAYHLKKPALLERYKVNLCMECGCCAYACPAKRRLVQVMRLSKPLLAAYRAEKSGSGKGGAGA